MRLPDSYFFITADVESDCIAQGIRTLSAARDEIEQESGMSIPITWFVRMQRTFQEYVNEDSPSYFQEEFEDGFDGFSEAKEELTRARDRSDEIGWHYHAYSYVHREDLGHERKVEIVACDLAACGRAIGRRHPEFRIRSFRWGWNFVPDYGLHRVLRNMGVDVDASVAPHKDGKPVADFTSTYLPSITSTPQCMDGTYYFPMRRTYLVHDWEVVAHEFGWRRLSAAEAAEHLDRYKARLRGLVSKLRESGGSFITYKSVVS